MAWSVLQSASGTVSVAATSLTVTYTTANVSSGTKLIAYVATSAAGGGGVISSVQDAALNSFTLIATVANGTAETTAIYAIDTPAGDVGTKPAIKVTVSNPIDISMLIQEVSGLATGSTIAAMIDGTVPAGTTGTGGTTTTSPTYTTTAANEYLVSVYGDNGGPETWTKPAALTADTSSVNSNSLADIAVAYGNSTNGAESATWALTGTAAGWGTLLVAFKLAAAGAAPATYTPQRYGQPAPASLAPWQQRDRRDANTVATVANPNVSPLDSAWQADGYYWHLYNDTAARDRRVYFQQRPYVSQPGFLLPPVNFDPTLGAAQDTVRHGHAAVYVDRREVPQQKDLRNAITLGTVAPVTDPTTAAYADTTRRYNTPATHVDRREVPQQRSYPDRQPDVAVTAGPATVQAWWSEDVLTFQVQRQYFPPPTVQIDVPVGSGVTEAWWGVDPGPFQIAQRRYISDPRFTPPDPVVAGPAVTQAWWSDDVLTFQAQRPYVSDPLLLLPPVPLDPTLAGWLPDWLEYNRAATHVDRREVPQQRAYISDPSFYPTTAPTDPLTLAWGAGGTYWLLYNTAAEQVDRRKVPQQRAYVSDPLLLTTALLENELLGGSETAKRYLLPATNVDRREVPQQRSYISDPSTYPVTAFDPLTVAWGDGGVYWSLYNTAALFVDRREVPQQRRYVSDPALLGTALLENELLGSADDLRRRYQQAALFVDRREVPQQRAYVSDPAVFGALLEGVLLGGADIARHGFAAYYDRREVPQQRSYPDRLPPPPAGTDPLLVTWGAGGVYWHLYNRAALNDTDRRSWWPPRLLYNKICVCVVFRPSAGTTTTPTTGRTTRPDTGVTADPCCDP